MTEGIKTKIIYYRESLVQSMLADLFTFFIIVGSVTFNELLVGSRFLNGILLFMFVIFIITKTNDKKHTFTTREDFLKYLDEE